MIGSAFRQTRPSPTTPDEAWADIIQNAGGPMNMQGYTNPDKTALNESVGAPGAIFGKPKRKFDIGLLGAYILAANGNPLGQFALQARQRNQELEQETRLREQAHQQAVEDARNTWLWQQQWTRDNPQPTEFDKQLDAAGITDPAQRQAAYADLVTNKREGSPYQFDVTGDGIPDIVPRAYYRNMIGGGQQPTGQQSGGFTEGQTATNPQTNERIIFRGGQWVPLDGGGAGSGPRTFP